MTPCLFFLLTKYNNHPVLCLTWYSFFKMSLNSSWYTYSFVTWVGYLDCSVAISECMPIIRKASNTCLFLPSIKWCSYAVLVWWGSKYWNSISKSVSLKYIYPFCLFLSNSANYLLGDVLLVSIKLPNSSYTQQKRNLEQKMYFMLLQVVLSFSDTSLLVWVHFFKLTSW